MGQRIQQAVKDNAPGPGNYDPNVNAVKDSIRNVKIANGTDRSQLNHSKSTNFIPGPG